jgi:hypothetical protein
VTKWSGTIELAVAKTKLWYNDPVANEACFEEKSGRKSS